MWWLKTFLFIVHFTSRFLHNLIVFISITFYFHSLFMKRKGQKDSKSQAHCNSMAGDNTLRTLDNTFKNCYVFLHFFPWAE